MDLFTYLLGKKGINSSVHGDLFSYLLGKGQSQIYTVSGTTIYIPNAKKLVSFMMTKESTQDGTPTPDNPVEVKVVEGYRNLFDKDNVINGYRIGPEGEPISNSGYSLSDYISVKANTTYIRSRNITTKNAVALYDNNKTFISRIISGKTFETTNNTYFIRTSILTDELNNLTLFEGDQELPYVPCGNNYIAVNVSDGTNTNSVSLPLNGNEIAGQGDNLDEYIVDKSGHCWLNKKYPKYIFTGEEEYGYSEQTNSVFFIREITDFQRSNNIPLCNYYLGKSNVTNASAASNRGNNSICFVNNPNGNFLYIVDNRYTTKEDFKNWVKEQYNNGTPLVIRYATNNPQLIDLNTTVDLKLFKGVNNISNSVDGYMTIQYR
jgi:hypothetical protein